MTDPIRRFITGILFGAFVIAVIFAFPNWAFCLVVTALTAAALVEYFTMVEKKGIFVYKYFGVVVGAVIPLVTCFQFAIGKDLEIFALIVICLLTFILQFGRKDSHEALAGISTTLFAILYISWLFSFLMKIKLLPDGAKLVMFLILVVKGGDIGAYFIGKTFGRHNLIPRISPRKSVEGTAAGLATSVVIALLFKRFMPEIPLLKLFFFGTLLGVLAQVGDLAESLIKRDCDVKDASNLFPGLGGVLDVIDSLLFAAPIFYFFLRARL